MSPELITAITASITALIVATISSFNAVRKGKFEQLEKDLQAEMSESDELRKRVKILEVEHVANFENIQKLTLDNITLNAELAKTKSELDILSNELSKANKTISELKSSLISVRDENDGLRSRIRELEGYNKTKDIKMENMSDAIAELESQVTELGGVPKTRKGKRSTGSLPSVIGD